MRKKRKEKKREEKKRKPVSLKNALDESVINYGLYWISWIHVTLKVNEMTLDITVAYIRPIVVVAFLNIKIYLEA